MHHMGMFDPTKPAKLHEQLNDRIDDWQPVSLEEWQHRARWHDAAQRVIDWDGLLYDGWLPA